MIQHRAKVCVVGSRGRMGQRIISQLQTHPHLMAHSFLDRPQAPQHNPSELQSALKDADVAIDFSAPTTCENIAEACIQFEVAYVVGSTGLQANHLQTLRNAAKKIPVLQATNFSWGVHVFLQAARMITAKLGDTFDLELMELHHRRKKDAPSGTALTIVEQLQSLRPDSKPLHRQGEHTRDGKEFGVASLRGGDVAGEHTLFFLGDGERLELSHRATSPDIFASGALRAGAWLLEQPPGYYSMQDVIANLTP